MTQKYVRKPVVEPVAEPAVKTVVVDKPYVREAYVPQPVIEQPVVKEVVVEPKLPEGLEIKTELFFNSSEEFAHKVFAPLLLHENRDVVYPFVKGTKLPVVEGDDPNRFIALARWAFINWVGETKATPVFVPKP
jgi:hypothetical protein